MLDKLSDSHSNACLMKQLCPALYTILLVLFVINPVRAQEESLLAALRGEHTYEAYYTIETDEQHQFSLLQWSYHEDPDYSAPEPYKRVYHFNGWIPDPSHQSCFDVRGLVLVRQALAPVNVDPNNSCRVYSSTWYDPYSDEYFRLAADLQIDHVVPLKNAYLAGAWDWKFEKRCNYSNFLTYPTHLMAVQKHANLSKGDRGPEAYLPINSNYQCQYIANWLKIKAVWDLKIAMPEAKAIHEFLSENNCEASLFQMNAEELNDLQTEAESPPESCSVIQNIESDTLPN